MERKNDSLLDMFDLHFIKKWNSSSGKFSLHEVQILWALGIFNHLPVSIARWCAPILSLARILRNFFFLILNRYSSNPKFCFILEYTFKRPPESLLLVIREIVFSQYDMNSFFKSVFSFFSAIEAPFVVMEWFSQIFPSLGYLSQRYFISCNHLFFDPWKNSLYESK